MTDAPSIVLGRHGQVAGLKDGSVTVEGCELDFVDVQRMPDAYRAMARTQPYDICEMAPTSYLMAAAAGAPITALPIPMTRRFRHAGLQRVDGSGLRRPQDLEGRRVGVRAYAVTAAVWTRGVYADEFGVDPDKVTWVAQEDENIEISPPLPNVQRVPAGRTLADLVRDGELDAVFEGLAGAGDGLGDKLTELVEDADERERRWFERTGVYPIHGVIVVRDEVLDRRPELAPALFDAFTRAKRAYLDRVGSGEATGPDDRRYRRLSELVGDPLPYGLEENAESLAALVRYAHRQHLVPERMPIERVFRDPRAARKGTE